MDGNYGWTSNRVKVLLKCTWIKLTQKGKVRATYRILFALQRQRNDHIIKFHILRCLALKIYRDRIEISYPSILSKFIKVVLNIKHLVFCFNIKHLFNNNIIFF